MKTYNIKWETHHKQAGGTGQVQAESEDDAKNKVRQMVTENSKFPQETIDNLLIEVVEEAV